MISPAEIKLKAERKYISFLKLLAEGKAFSRIDIPGDKSYTKSSLSDFEKEILLLISKSKLKRGFGYTVDFQKVRTKYLGTQDLPSTIYFDSEKDFLKYLDKEQEVKYFKLNCEKIVIHFPELKNWVVSNPVKVIQNQNKWDDILKVCDYFRNNPIPMLFIRELPINVHTKFIEQNQGIIRDILDVIIPGHVNAEEKDFEKRYNLKYSEPQVRFKILDSELSNRFFSGIDDIAIPVSQFEKLELPVKKVIVVENKTTLYTTLTLPGMQKGIAIFGSGYKIYNLRNTGWLNHAEILYWGDIDVQGFEILSQFRTYFPHTKSFLMDRLTFDRFFENDLGTPSSINTILNLTNSETDLYNILKANNWRLEQEKIPFSYVKEQVKSRDSGPHPKSEGH